MKYKRRSKKPLKQYLIKKLDEVFKRYVRTSNIIPNTNMVRCCTCRRLKPFKEIHAGHFISCSYKSLRWDERNVHPQCYRCNSRLRGNLVEYSYYLNKKYDYRIMDILIAMKHEEMAHPIKLMSEELIEKIEYYENKLKELG